jgi:dienelactone hydrolase
MSDAVTVHEREVSIPTDGPALPGRLRAAEGSVGTVIFAHGSGSSRFSPRNREVASVLEGGGLATLLFDLLTEEEATDRALVFDIPLLARRLRAACDFVGSPGGRSGLIGLFGASTGAAAALVAASEDARVAAVVSRGGRPDLAGGALERVRAPTLLIVGGADEQVLSLNREALDSLACEKDLAVVEGATHLFEEPGALERVAALARAWFDRHLRVGPEPS